MSKFDGILDKLEREAQVEYERIVIVNIGDTDKGDPKVDDTIRRTSADDLPEIPGVVYIILRRSGTKVAHLH